MRQMWRDFAAGDWLAFFQGGPIRNAIYECGKRVIRWFDTW
jgi:hypothetical protein